MQLVRSDCPGGDGHDEAAARLRKLIARKRAEKERLERDIAAVQAPLAELFALRDRCLEPVDDEIHEHFDFVLQEPRFSPAARAGLRELYTELMMNGTISPRAMPGEAEPAGDEGDEDATFLDGTEPNAEAADGGRVHVPPRREPGDSRSLRDLYRELASRYHPDKAGDEETRVEHERLMREINGAYQAGDLDGLAALSRELGFEIAGDGVLEALALQYERLKAEVRALRHDRLGALVVETRRCEKSGESPPLADMAEDLRAHAEHLEVLATVFRAYRNGETGPDELLLTLLGDDDDLDDDEDLDLHDMIDALVALAAMAEPPTASRAAPRRRKR